MTAKQPDTPDQLELLLDQILETMATDCERVHQAQVRGTSVATTPMDDHAKRLRQYMSDGIGPDDPIVAGYYDYKWEHRNQLRQEIRKAFGL